MALIASHSRTVACKPPTLGSTGGFFSRATSGRRRVKANSMPSVIDTASIDEPPADTKGSVMPLAGKRPDVDAHVDQRLQSEHEREPLDR